jgi:hypothetical protein
MLNKNNMATANFNTTIESLGDGVNEYDLSVVLTLSGFNARSVSYRLSPIQGVSVKYALMVIDANVYGKINIEVSDGVNVANAITEISGFYAKKTQILDNQKYKESLGLAKNDWAEIISGNNNNK